jgi:hypothetical protein
MKSIVRQLSLVLVLSLAACGGSSTSTSTAPKTSVATAQAADLNVELLTDSRLEVGMTPVYVKVTTASGAVVKDATVTMTPLMAMSGGTMHSAPVVGSPAFSDDEYYGCAVVFSMPSGTMGSWSAKASVQRPGAAAVEATFSNLTVADTGRARSFTFTDPTTSATTKYLVSLNFKATPKVGLNPVIVTLHRMQDMMTFVPVDDATIALDPQMPSMGHGSPGSVNPTLTSLGRYEGQLSFSMAGNWQTTISLSKSTSEALGSVTIAITF